jgi:hypothetical protein
VQHIFDSHARGDGVARWIDVTSRPALMSTATNVQLKCTMLLILSTVLNVHLQISKMCELF